MAYYCEVQEVIPPKDPSEPWRFICCRSYKIQHLFEVSFATVASLTVQQLGHLPGFSAGKWNIYAPFSGAVPQVPLTFADSEHGGDHTERAAELGPGRLPMEGLGPHEHHSTAPGTIATYKGRPLRKDNWLGQTRFIDDAAIFVRHLSRQETEQTLVERFSKYGQINGVEMEYGRCQGRVMFTEEKAAAAAIQFEVSPLTCGLHY